MKTKSVSKQDTKVKDWTEKIKVVEISDACITTCSIHVANLSI